MRYKLMAWRKLLGYNQIDIASKLGITVSTYSNIENNKRNCGIDTWLKIQNIFGFDDAEMWSIVANKED